MANGVRSVAGQTGEQMPASIKQELYECGDWKHSLRPSQRIYLPFKRFFDIVLSLIALIVLSPLFLIIAIIIKIDSPGPVFYKIQGRVGKGGKLISYLKFRSMVVNADEIKDTLKDLNEMDGPVFKIRRDPRLTRVGRFLRKYSIDETPQFVSVILGDMSIIGPRPLAVYELEPCTKQLQEKRHSIRPGITCFWQTRGRNEISSFSEWMNLDMMYIDKMSPITDLKIILKTIPAVLFGSGAC